MPYALKQTQHSTLTGNAEWGLSNPLEIKLSDCKFLGVRRAAIDPVENIRGRYRTISCFTPLIPKTQRAYLPGN